MELNFKDFLTLTQYQEIIDAEISNKKIKNNELFYDKTFTKEELFYDGLINYLKKRVEYGILEALVSSETHTSDLIISWNNLINGKLDKSDESTFKILFSKVFESNIFESINENNRDVKKGYEKLIEQMNQGNFDTNSLVCLTDCYDCAKKIKLISKNWKFCCVNLEYNSNKKLQMERLKPCLEKKLYEVRVEFKTGELLIADWFRIEEFTDQVTYNKNYNEVSIGYTLGKVNLTEHSAKLGFVTVNVSNSTPRIFQKEDSLLFGEKCDEKKDEDEKEDKKQKIVTYKERGCVSTDLWNVTVIDKSRLIEIVAIKRGEEDATKMVNDYIEKNDVTVVHMKQGNYIINYNPRVAVINKYDDDIPKSIKTIVSIKRELPRKNLKMISNYF